MDDEKFKKQVLKRLDHIEKAIFGTAGVGLTKKTPKIYKKNTLPKLILQSRERGSFKQPKTPQEIHKKLQPIYSCDLNRVEVALLRLHEKRQLRKASKVVGRKKVTAYVW